MASMYFILNASSVPIARNHCQLMLERFQKTMANTSVNLVQLGLQSYVQLARSLSRLVTRYTKRKYTI